MSRLLNLALILAGPFGVVFAIAGIVVRLALGPRPRRTPSLPDAAPVRAIASVRRVAVAGRTVRPLPAPTGRPRALTSAAAAGRGVGEPAGGAR